MMDVYISYTLIEYTEIVNIFSVKNDVSRHTIIKTYLKPNTNYLV